MLFLGTEDNKIVNKTSMKFIQKIQITEFIIYMHIYNLIILCSHSQLQGLCCIIQKKKKKALT